ncbi:MAG: YchF/TatD family DNA exonuclease [Candidatus Aminicenantes bacterium]|nr:YchF/TatD family DNA exonuclease [Candidatus Aminicenantes bacterium]
MSETNKREEKPELVDSHAHLDMKAFDHDRDRVIERALEAGVRMIICPAEATSLKSLEITLNLTSKFKGLFAAAGIHPHKATDIKADLAQKLQHLAAKNQIIAIGEIGLDFHYNFSPPQKQIDVFRRQLRIAQELSLPVIIHSREAGPEIINSINQENFHKGGILHCFTEDWETAKEMLDHNFLISFSGILTYPKAQTLRDVAQEIPLKKLLVETDSPYLVPASYRGKIQRNEPSFVVETAEVLAGIKKVSLADLSAATTENFISIFRFEKKNIR